MKIGIDIRATQTEHGGRGVGRYVFDLIDGMLRVGGHHDYVLFGIAGAPIPPGVQELPPNFRLTTVGGPLLHADFKRWYLGVPGFGRTRFAQRANYESLYRTQVQSFTDKVNAEALDVIHLPAPIDVHVCSDGEFNCRRVATFFDAVPLAMPDQFLRRWSEISQIHFKRQMETYRKANVVVAISNASRRDAIRFLDLPPEKVVTVHCGARPRSQTTIDDAAARLVLSRFGVTSPFFIFCSVCDFHKNWERMLEAYRLTRNEGLAIQLVMVTARDDWHFPRVQKLLRDLNLTEADVIVTGRVTDEELSILYSRALALISPAFYEGFGLPALEAMTFGTPVIASDRTSLPEVVGDAGLFFDPTDTAAMATAMKKLLTQPDLRANLSAKSATRASLFSVERQATGFLAVYAGQRPPTPAVSE